MSRRTIPTAVAARDLGIFIIVVAIGQSVDNIELQGLASLPWSLTIVRMETFNLLLLPESRDTMLSMLFDGEGRGRGRCGREAEGGSTNPPGAIQIWKSG